MLDARLPGGPQVKEGNQRDDGGGKREEIRIQLKSGSTVTIGIIARAPELVLARSDEKLQYYFRPELAQRLLSPPAAAGEPLAKK